MKKCIFTALALFSSISLFAEDSGVKAALSPYVERGEIPGYISILIDTNRTEMVIDGWADVENKIPLKADSLFRICSQTKGMCGTLVALLCVEGKLSLEDPVYKYLPEFRNLKRLEKGSDGKEYIVPCKETMLVRDVVSHGSGLDFQTPVSKVLGWNTVPLRVAAAISATYPLRKEPGTEYYYSNAGIDVAAAIVEVVTGERFEDHLQRRLLDPLGMKETTFFPKEEQLKRLVKIYGCETNGVCRLYGDGINYEHLLNRSTPGLDIHPSAGAGLFSTAVDLVKFYRMLAFEGLDEKGKRIIPKEVITDYLYKQQCRAKGNYSMGFWFSGDWFGHDGALKSVCLVEPKLHLVRFWMMNVVYEKPEQNRWHQYNVWQPVVDRFFDSNAGKHNAGSR